MSAARALVHCSLGVHTGREMPSSARSPAFDVTVLHAQYGGVGPATEPPRANAWVSAAIDVEARQMVSSLAVAALDLRDDGGRVLARVTGPVAIEVVPANRPIHDLTSTGQRFSGAIEAGERLRIVVHGALDTRLEVLAKSNPNRVHIELASDRDRQTVDGALGGEWPTAGPVAR